jgi:hypothetical protein
MGRYEMKNIRIKKIILTACSGSDIDSCIQESLRYAVNEWEKTVLIFNDKEYQIDPKQILVSIYNQYSDEEELK